MTKYIRENQYLLSLIIVLFFSLTLLNIVFSLLGVFCLIIPFIMLALSKKNIWCKYYCPRSSVLMVFLSKISLRLKPPKWLISNAKNILIMYFGLNLFFAVMSTIMVSVGRIPPIDYVRFMIVFRVPFDLPQFVDLETSPILLHFSYRIYSIMFSSTVIGLVLGFIYYPRTWCSVCPMKQALNYVKK
ncbi:hypothetical protein RI065_00935 [Mycoplasmatota bacterium zrk1]